MSRKRVLVAGATGQIGIFAIPRLLAAGFEVIAVSRQPAPGWYPRLEGLEWVHPDMLGHPTARDATMLLSAGPAGVGLLALERCRGIERAVVFSTTSVHSKSDSSDPVERRAMRQILEVEAEIAALCDERGIALCLFRPTLVYGAGVDRNVSWLARWIRKFGFVPLAGRAAGLRQPVHADDLARAAVSALAQARPLALETPLCGGSTLSYRVMVEAIFRGLGRPARIVPVPTPLLAAFARLAGFLPGLRGVTPAMVQRQAVDLVFDDRLARESLDYDPRPFAPGAGDFKPPGADLIRRTASR